jgi:ariadne-2
MCLGDWKAHGSEYYECSRYKENPNIAHESVHAQAREALKKYLHYYERVSMLSDNARWNPGVSRYFRDPNWISLNEIYFLFIAFSVPFQWENHSKSLKLEEQTSEHIKMRINHKVMNASGTWIDWQHLFEAASLLARCRYTLQYTYPYAYYMESGPRKELVRPGDNSCILMFDRNVYDEKFLSQQFEYQQAQLEAEIENLSWKIERAETTDRGDLENQMDIAEKRRVTLLKDFLEV